MIKGKILILESNRATLTVIRSLSKNGFDTVVGYIKGINEEKFVKFSRYTMETWSHPGFHEEERFTEALLCLLKERSDIDYIFPVGDTSSGLLARNYNRIIPYCEIIMAKPAVIDTCLDKIKSYKYVIEQNVPLPEMEVVRNLLDVDTQIEKIGYPFILKPKTNLIPFFGKKCIICDTPNDYKKFFPHWPEGHQELVFQRKVSGFRHDCMFTAIKGNIVCYFEKKILRTDKYDSTGYEVELVTVKPSDQRKKYIELLVLALDYSGIGCIQFIVNEENDSSYFLEFNPRLDYGNALPYLCGLDFTKQAIDVHQYLSGEIVSLPQYSKDYRLGMRIHWLFGDITGILKDLNNKEISILQGIVWILRIAISIFRSPHHMTWSWKDPLPTLVLYKQEFLNIIIHRLNRLRLCKTGNSSYDKQI